MKTYKGWKLLNPSGATEYQGEEFVYPLPAPDQKWGPWIEHPDPAKPDGNDCGPGRLHQMKRLDARYAPSSWWPWYCEGEGLVGESEEKRGVHRLRLRRVSRKAFSRMIRLGWCQEAKLRGADLRKVDLWGADLRGANLREADLRGADLREADLRWADLREADLRLADLRGAKLRGVSHSEQPQILAALAEESET